MSFLSFDLCSGMICERRHVDGVRPFVNVAFAISNIDSNILFVVDSGDVVVDVDVDVAVGSWGSLVILIIFFTNMFLFLITLLLDLLILEVLLHIICFVISLKLVHYSVDC